MKNIQAEQGYYKKNSDGTKLGIYEIFGLDQTGPDFIGKYSYSMGRKTLGSFT